MSDRLAAGLWWAFGLMLPVVAAIACAVLWPDGVAWAALALVAFAAAAFDAYVGPFG